MFPFIFECLVYFLFITLDYVYDLIINNNSFDANFVRYIYFILFKLVFISQCYHKSSRGELF